MLANHPMAEQTAYMKTLNELVQERNFVGQPTNTYGSMMNLAEAANLAETGHVFDHEPGYADYHHGMEHHDEYAEHAEFYGDARYPLFNLQAQNPVAGMGGNPDIFRSAQERHYGHPRTDEDHHAYMAYQAHHMNEAESNLYHSWPVYSPIASHEWTLHHK